MASQHANHPFSARVPEAVLTGFRGRVESTGATQTAALIGLLDFYATGDVPSAIRTEVALSIHAAMCPCPEMGGDDCAAKASAWTLAATAAHHAATAKRGVR